MWEQLRQQLGDLGKTDCLLCEVEGAVIFHLPGSAEERAELDSGQGIAGFSA